MAERAFASGAEPPPTARCSPYPARLNVCLIVTFRAYLNSF